MVQKSLPFHFFPVDQNYLAMFLVRELCEPVLQVDVVRFIKIHFVSGINKKYPYFAQGGWVG